MKNKLSDAEIFDKMLAGIKDPEERIRILCLLEQIVYLRSEVALLKVALFEIVEKETLEKLTEELKNTLWLKEVNNCLLKHLKATKAQKEDIQKQN